MSDLENEANPFGRDALDRWLADARSDRDLDHQEQQGSEGSKDRPFWDIPRKDLQLLHVVASGAAGNVWAARQISRNNRKVAAKHLKAMSDMCSHDEALSELINEVYLFLIFLPFFFCRLICVLMFM